MLQVHQIYGKKRKMNPFLENDYRKKFNLVDSVEKNNNSSSFIIKSQSGTSMLNRTIQSKKFSNP
jgi:hypothetical protein